MTSASPAYVVFDCDGVLVDSEPLSIEAARAMGWKPSSCVVVEDSPYGVDAALAADMRAIAYAGGVTPAHRLARPGVTIITDMRDLPKAIVAMQADELATR